MRIKILIIFLGCSMALRADEAIFAGGCFWCMQPAYDEVKGVTKTVVGYTGGSVIDPTYEQVSSGSTGHIESIEVFYNPDQVSYEELLDVFWHNIDPTVENKQFCDVGEQYRSAIFYLNEKQKELAEQSKAQLVASGQFKTIYTEILPAGHFYPAEEYHQKYAEKNPIRYKYYRYSCGRDARLKEVWGDSRLPIRKK